MSSITPLAPKSPTFNWRAHLRVHPAAELFPLMAETDSTAFKELAADIKKHGRLLEAITLWRRTQNDDWQLLDGRNRLDAMALAGMLEVNVHGRLCHAGHADKDWTIYTSYRSGGDPFALALSFNVHRRHLTNEVKNRLIAKLIKANPKKSNRRIAEQVKASHPYVGKIRTRLEKAGDVETVSTSIDTKGRKQPAKRKDKVEKKPNSIVKSDSVKKVVCTPGTQSPLIIASPAPIETAINVAPEAKPVGATDAAGASGLGSTIEREWREAARAFEILTSHTPAQVATAISPEDVPLITEVANYFAELKAKLATRPAGNGEALAGSDCSIPDDLSISHCLQRGA
jgi:DNA-binding Lrp family transcriptional regulator